VTIYFSISHQQKRIRDITAILRTEKDQLDLSYIEQWAKRLGLTTTWEELL
jgi:hypothetical protein